MRPLLSLVMIVKDESASIKRVLETVKPVIDRYTILDTGSTDNTQSIVREVMADVPGSLHEEPFIDYAASRNRALQLDGYDLVESPENAAVFTLMLSGDEYLRDGEKLRAYLETQRESAVDAFKVRLQIDDASLYPPRVFRTTGDWHYEDAGCGVHEFPTNSNPEALVGELPMRGDAPWIEHIVSDLERRCATIWEKHIPMLQKKLEEDPQNTRALIFLASSYESLFDGFSPEEKIKYAMEAMGLYLRRFAIQSGSDAERSYLMMRYLTDARMTGVYSNEELFVRAEQLTEADYKRPDTAMLCANFAVPVRPLPRVYELACRAAKIAAAAKEIVNDSPVSMDCEWKAHHLAAVAAKQLALKHPEIEMRSKYAGFVREHAAEGERAGGPAILFEELVAQLQESK